MKLLSLCIILGSLIISFNYVWINRLDIRKISFETSGEYLHVFLITNKWTGNHCVLGTHKKDRNGLEGMFSFPVCKIDPNYKITFP